MREAQGSPTILFVTAAAFPCAMELVLLNLRLSFRPQMRADSENIKDFWRRHRVMAEPMSNA